MKRKDTLTYSLPKNEERPEAFNSRQIGGYGIEMRSQVFGLVLLICFVGLGDLISPLFSPGSQSACPTVAVDCADDIDKSVLVFKVKLSGQKVTHQTLTYKWTAYEAR